MSKVGVSLNINVKEIEKGRLFTGQKGTYLNCTVFVDLGEADQYGNNGMITQEITKEEKANGVQGKILGNCKVFWQEGKQQQQSQQPQGQQQAPQNNSFDGDFEDNSIPF